MPPGFFVLISGLAAGCALHLSNMYLVAQIVNVGFQTRLCDSLSLATDSVAVLCPCLLSPLLWKFKGRVAQL